jgi:hypothetical protein
VSFVARLAGAMASNQALLETDQSRAGSRVPIQLKGALSLRGGQSVIHDHFDVDEKNGTLLGPLTHDDNRSRDIHDWFNLIALIPMCVLNGLNWDWSRMGTGASPPELWNYSFFLPFYIFAYCYFFTDTLWMLILPNAVKSPGVILQHHIAVLFYMLIPIFYPEYEWIAGVNLSVEINTWLIIARRVFNKGGLLVWDVGGGNQLKIISILFYITWIVIRCIIYPVVLVWLIPIYIDYSNKQGNYFNVLAVCPIFQIIFCALNFKWTYDLIMSKLKAKKGDKPSQGL